MFKAMTMSANLQNLNWSMGWYTKRSQCHRGELYFAQAGSGEANFLADPIFPLAEDQWPA